MTSSDRRDGGSTCINARALTVETAAAIASVDYRDGAMKERRLYTAWDSRNDEQRLFRGLQLLVDAGVKPRHIMVYMLVGYWAGETHEDRDNRRRKLREFGARPYPMPYTRTTELVAFQRWVIGSYDKSILHVDGRQGRATASQCEGIAATAAAVSEQMQLAWVLAAAPELCDRLLVPRSPFLPGHDTKRAPVRSWSSCPTPCLPRTHRRSASGRVRSKIRDA
jgi:hypothetical protein